MVRLISIILSVVYFSLSTGTIVAMHYCSDKLQSVQLNTVPKSCCGDEDGINHSCCENSFIVLDIDIDQKISVSDNLLPSFQLVASYFKIIYNVILEEKNQNTRLNNDFIPPPPKEPLWIMKCSLTYYG